MPPLIPPPPLERIRRNGWTIGRHAAIPLKVPLDWSRAHDNDRSWAFHFLALDLIDPLLVDHAAGGEAGSLDLALSIARDWWNHIDDHPVEALWYDMGVGLRAWRLAYLYRAATAAGSDPSDVDWLRDCLVVHERRLVPDADFNTLSNHGFFQAAGLLAVASLFWAQPDSRSLARSRLERVLSVQFAADGVHKEHSPDYHFFLYRGFAALEAQGLLGGGVLGERLAAMAEALGWFVRPDGRLANFGDSDNRLLKAEERADLPPPLPGFKVLSEGGYVVLRTPTGGYLAQTAGFHSHVHKQADDLSLIWHARGQDVLIDAGRLMYGTKAPLGSDLRERGFRYTDPRRIYCESLEGHNALEIAGAQDCRQGRPYGSAIVATQARSGVIAVVTRVARSPFEHTRMILGDGDNWLVIVDGVAESWRRRRPALRQWLHLGPGSGVTSDPHGFVATTGEQRLRIAGLTEARPEGPWEGRTGPEIQGWWSPRANGFEPAPVVAFSDRRAVIATGLAFDDFGSTTGRLGLNGRLCGTLRLSLGDHRTVAVTFDGANLGLEVEGRVG